MPHASSGESNPPIGADAAIKPTRARWCRHLPLKPCAVRSSSLIQDNERGSRRMAVSCTAAHCPTNIIRTGIRWSLAYPLRTRHVEQLGPACALTSLCAAALAVQLVRGSPGHPRWDRAHVDDHEETAEGRDRRRRPHCGRTVLRSRRVMPPPAGTMAPA